MAEVTGFKVKFDKATLRAIEQAPVRALNALAEEVVAEGKRRSPVADKNGGTNKRSIDWETIKAQESRRIFTTSGYGGLLEIGTGLFGPRKKKIFPKRKKALHWGGKGGPVVAWTRGMPPQPYFVPAMRDVQNRAATVLKDVVPDDRSA